MVEKITARGTAIKIPAIPKIDEVTNIKNNNPNG
jgi:hypothetical protein